LEYNFILKLSKENGVIFKTTKCYVVSVRHSLISFIAGKEQTLRGEGRPLIQKQLQITQFIKERIVSV